MSCICLFAVTSVALFQRLVLLGSERGLVEVRLGTFGDIFDSNRLLAHVTGLSGDFNVPTETVSVSLLTDSYSDEPLCLTATKMRLTSTSDGAASELDTVRERLDVVT